VSPLPDYRKGDRFELITSLNPFLNKYAYFDMGAIKCQLFLYNFDELLKEADEITFYTYLKEVDLKKSKLRIRAMPGNPLMAVEMEVRFHFDKERELQGSFCLDDEGPEAVRWTGLTNLAKELSEKLTPESNYFFKDGKIQFMGYYTTKYLLQKPVEIEKKAEESFESTICLIEEYDRSIQEIALQIAESLV
jgi:hypothetical protein